MRALAPHDLADNWHALAICIFKRRPRPCNFPEMAFALLDGRKNEPEPRVDPGMLIELKRAMTYQEIADMFGLTRGAVYNRIRYARDPEKYRAYGRKERS